LNKMSPAEKPPGEKSQVKSMECGVAAASILISGGEAFINKVRAWARVSQWSKYPNSCPAAVFSARGDHDIGPYFNENTGAVDVSALYLYLNIAFGIYIRKVSIKDVKDRLGEHDRKNCGLYLLSATPKAPGNFSHTWAVVKGKAYDPAKSNDEGITISELEVTHKDLKFVQLERMREDIDWEQTGILSAPAAIIASCTAPRIWRTGVLSLRMVASRNGSSIVCRAVSSILCRPARRFRRRRRRRRRRRQTKGRG
jgi:hypothetical protein